MDDTTPSPASARPRRLGRTDRIAVAVIIAAAFAVRLIVARRLPNLLYPDEIFQTLEQGHRLFLGSGVEPWEYRVGLRNWVFPGFLGVVMYLTRWLGSGSAGYLLGVWIVLCAASVLPVYVTYRWTRPRWGTPAAIAAACACAAWFELVYFAPKAFFGTIAAWVLIYGLYRGTLAADLGERRRWFLFGVLCGAAVGLRLQYAVGVAVAYVFLCRVEIRSRWVPAIAGAALALAIFGGVDWITWGTPFYSFFENFYVNVQEHVASEFGTAPLWWYFGTIAKIWWIATPFVVALAVYGAWKKHLWTLAVAIAIVLSVSIVPHKEYRFIVAGVFIVVVAAAIGLGRLVAAIAPRIDARPKFAGVVAGVGIVAAVATSISLSMRYTPAITGSYPTGGQTDISQFEQQRGQLLAFGALSRNKHVCGVVFDGNSIFWSGGYTWLNLEVDIAVESDPEGILELANDDVANAIVTTKQINLERLPGRWTVSGPRDGVRTYVGPPTDCRPIPDESTPRPTRPS